MKIHSFSKFLSVGSAQLPAGFVAVGIHPTSEVDLFELSGTKVTVGSLLPLESGMGAPMLKAMRWAVTNSANMPGTVTQQQASDGILDSIGENLVLQCYERGDALIPPGPRVPLYRDYNRTVGTPNAANSNLMMRVPFHGRATAKVQFSAANTTSIAVYGHTMGFRTSNITRRNPADPAVAELGLFTELVGSPLVGANTVSAHTGVALVRCVYFGGNGDSGEDFDELLFYGFDTAGNPTVPLIVEVYGERHH